MGAMPDEDLVLLDRWCAGDAASGNRLFKRHFDELYAFFSHNTQGDIDDLVQETFMACVRSRENFRRQSTFRTFLFAIARHTLFAYWRRRSADRKLDFEEISIASLSTSVGTRISRRQDQAALLEALRALPLEQQILLEMYYWQELDRDELAEVFEVETATIGSRLFRARRALQEHLARAQHEAEHAFDAWARSMKSA
jgi:RNA polymerase sigma factor (sigma-70 family)